jgi:hypothetical protein
VELVGRDPIEMTQSGCWIPNRRMGCLRKRRVVFDLRLIAIVGPLCSPRKTMN